MGAVVVLTILATLVCGGGVYTAFSGKLGEGVSALMQPFCSVSLLNRYSARTLLLVADLWLTNDTESVSDRKSVV